MKLKNELEKALQYENEGDINTALSCFNEALSGHPNDRLAIMFEMACFFFRTKQYTNALDLMIECHKSDYEKNEIEDIVMEAYYTPNVEEFANRYNRNISFLKKYDGCIISHFPDFKELTYKFIPFSEKKYNLFNKHKKTFTTIIDFSSQTLEIPFDSKQIYALKNEYNIANLTALKKQTRQDNTNSFATTQMPIFLIYEDKDVFLEHLQIFNLAPLLENDRIIFLFGLQETIEYFSKETAILPNLYINMGNNDSYYKSIEEAKLSMIKKGGINYQNLMQLFNASFNTKKCC